MVLPLLLLSAALAAREPGDYRAAVFQGAARELEVLNGEGRFEDVLKLGERFTERVEPGAPVLYEMAYAANRMGRSRDALRLYDQALRLQPDLAVALYDRGELRLLQGDDAGALADFQAAALARPDHWAIHFRLAHLAGRRGDAAALDTHLVEALRVGFDFRTVVEDPDWKAWSRDPKLGPVIKRLLVVYSDEAIFEQLQREP